MNETILILSKFLPTIFLWTLVANAIVGYVVYRPSYRAKDRSSGCAFSFIVACCWLVVWVAHTFLRDIFGLPATALYVVVLAFLECGIISMIHTEIKESRDYRKSVTCPNCGSQDDYTVHTTASGTYESTETRTRRQTHYSATGKEIGYTEEEYEAPVTREWSDSDKQCNKCKKQW